MFIEATQKQITYQLHFVQKTTILNGGEELPLFCFLS